LTHANRRLAASLRSARAEHCASVAPGETRFSPSRSDYGWLNDHPLARFIALAKMLQVVDGTAEVQRLVIARGLDERAESLP
jgi:alkylation response protein AidB-like acyl-CoA dehydrogenase